VCEAGLNNFINGWINTSMKRRAARHASTAIRLSQRLVLVVPNAADTVVPRILDYGAIFFPTHLPVRTTFMACSHRRL